MKGQNHMLNFFLKEKGKGGGALRAIYVKEIKQSFLIYLIFMSCLMLNKFGKSQ